MMSLEEQLITAHITQQNRAWIINHEKELKLSFVQKIRKFFLLRKVHRGEPLPYVLGFKEWYGRTFLVNRATLIPRPETEMMIELLATSLQENVGNFDPSGVLGTGTARNDVVVVDVGTGTGCIAITAALEFPTAKVIATDSSSAALRVARKNAQLLNAHISFLDGSLLDPFLSSRAQSRDPFQKNKHIFITANLPYIPTHEYLELPNAIKKFEPRSALDGGTDGLDYYRLLFAQLASLPNAIPFTLFCEIMPDQETPMRTLAQIVFPHHTILFHKDLTNLTRIIEIKSSQP